MLARLESPHSRVSAEEMAAAARFVLRCQNPDGSFGSYEARRTPFPLEWLNPAEMFGDSMSEAAYVECTASCIAALAAFRKHYPELMRHEVNDALARAKGEAVRLNSATVEYGSLQMEIATRRALLDQLHVRAHPRAIRTRARLGRGEAALLAAIDRPLARHQRPLAPDPAWLPDSIVDRMSDRRR